MFKSIKEIIPLSVKQSVGHKIKSLKLIRLHQIQNKEIKRVRNKRKINVAFLLVNESIWKYEELYFLLEKDERFIIKIFICPFTAFGDQQLKTEMENTFISMKNRGYNIVQTLQEDGSYLDIKKDFDPDLVFFSTPHNITLPQYRIGNFLDTLTCYVNYSYTTSNLYEAQYNAKLHVFCWKYFLESKFHKEMSEKFSDRKGKNTLVTGYAGTDIFLNTKYSPKDLWKKQEKKKKRIIWAPHHTIEGNLEQFNQLNYATFLRYSKFMIDLVEKYRQDIQFAFKPHPSLKPKLYQVWGEERTEEYYKFWQVQSNTQLEEGGYVDLFLESDAMIHDSSSFLIEYLYTQKPVLFLINNEDIKNQFSLLGKIALSKIQQGYSEEVIYKFIDDTVLAGNDLYKNKRMEFFEEYLKPPGNRLASENIYNYLLENLISQNA